MTRGVSRVAGSNVTSPLETWMLGVHAALEGTAQSGGRAWDEEDAKDGVGKEPAGDGAECAVRRGRIGLRRPWLLIRVPRVLRPDAPIHRHCLFHEARAATGDGGKGILGFLQVKGWSTSARPATRAHADRCAFTTVVSLMPLLGDTAKRGKWRLVSSHGPWSRNDLQIVESCSFR